MDKLLKICEVSLRTGTEESTWRAWIQRRRVTFVKLGRSVRIPESVLSRMITEGTVPARGKGVSVKIEGR
jgi:excisionase family DNA binding protein